MSDVLRIGVIGAGLMGEVHARNVTSITGARVVALMDADGGRAGALAAELGARASTEALEVIRADDVDALIVASPDATHAVLTIAAIRAGKPVLCEKPLASTLADAAAVVAAEVASGNRLVQVGFIREFDPAHQAVRGAVESGRLGRPVMFRGSHINPESVGFTDATRAITQSMIHDIHSARFLTGRRIAEVFARAVADSTGPQGSCRLATVSLVFDDGSLGLLDLNVASGYGYEVIAEVVCERGTATTALPTTATVRQAGQARVAVTPGWQDRFVEAYRIEIGAWLNSIRTAVPVGPGALDGWAANAVADAACRSLISGRSETVPTGP